MILQNSAYLILSPEGLAPRDIPSGGSVILLVIKKKNKKKRHTTER